MNETFAKYLISYACFKCRLTFKRDPDLKEHKCPQCSNEMEIMGRAFTAPKKKDTEQWEKLEYLVENGFSFHHYNDERYGPYPKTLKEAHEFVARNKGKLKCT
jgi:DNA-directed RNA polymerase subunit RPC12/RpoP